MKRLTIAFAALFVLSGTAAIAAGRGHDKFDGDGDGPPGLANKPYGLPPGQAKKLWRRGERLPELYIGPRYFVAEPRMYHLAPPRPGHRWVVIDGDAYLVEVATGLIAETVFGAVAVNYGPRLRRLLWSSLKPVGAHVTRALTPSRKIPTTETATRA